MKEISCCFTGHRILPRDRIEDIRNATRDQIELAYKNGYRRFLCGGALGYDTLCALLVLEMRRSLPDIKLILVYPCMEQDAMWSERDRQIYRDVYARCDECYCVSDLYTEGCMHKRNRIMVDSSSMLIACIEKKSGGAAYTYDYALKAGIKTVNVYDGGKYAGKR